MRILALLLAGLLGSVIIFFIRATVDFYYRRLEEKDHLEIHLSAIGGLWKFKFQIPTARLMWEKGPEFEISGKAKTETGEEQDTKLDIRFRFFWRRYFYHLWPRIPSILTQLNQVKVKLYKGIHCTFLDWRVIIGCEDAAYTALAAGSIWSMLGYSLAKLYRQVTVDVDQPHLAVIPNFKQPGFSCECRCVFKLRIGHIMIAGLDLLRLLMHEKRML